MHAVEMADMKAAFCIAAVVSLIHVATAADYIVGSPTGGWEARMDYKSWASAQTFAPGDSITFKYNSNHNVVEVTKDDYEACSTTSPVSYDNSGSTTIVLAAPGKRYFICGAPGHCQAGMKLEVDVADRPAPTTPSAPPELPPPQHEKQRSALAPMPLSPAPTPWSPAPAPAAEPPRHAGHKKHKRHSPPPKPTPARAPAVQSMEAYFPLAVLAPMSSPAPPPPMSSHAAAVLHAKWGEVRVGLVALGLVVLFL